MYTLAELRELPVIQSGRVNDLVVQTHSIQVWVRREDGEGRPSIVVNGPVRGGWQRIGEYADQLPAAVQFQLQIAQTQQVGDRR